MRPGALSTGVSVGDRINGATAGVPASWRTSCAPTSPRGVCSPGERLPPEPELCVKTGVSRSTVREALRLLASQHLIVTTRGVTGGSFVAHPDAEQLSEGLSTGLTLLSQHGRGRARRSAGAAPRPGDPGRRPGRVAARGGTPGRDARCPVRPRQSTSFDTMLRPTRHSTPAVATATGNPLFELVDPPALPGVVRRGDPRRCARGLLGADRRGPPGAAALHRRRGRRGGRGREPPAHRLHRSTAYGDAAVRRSAPDAAGQQADGRVLTVRLGRRRRGQRGQHLPRERRLGRQPGATHRRHGHLDGRARRRSPRSGTRSSASRVAMASSIAQASSTAMRRSSISSSAKCRRAARPGRGRAQHAQVAAVGGHGQQHDVVFERRLCMRSHQLSHRAPSPQWGDSSG